MTKQNKVILALAGGLLLLACVDWSARAQQAVVTQPGKANSGDASGTIASSNVFQQIWGSTAGPDGAGQSGQRAGCLVLNNAGHREWVYFQGPGMTTPTSANSSTLEASAVPLEAAPATNGQGGYVYCNTGAGQVLQDSVWIAGTIGDTYVAKQQ